MLTPYSRENMRAFKAVKDVEANNMKMDSVVKQIYSNAVRFAELNDGGVYRCKVTKYSGSWGSITVPSILSGNYNNLPSQVITHEYVVENMDEVLCRLRSLFPDCLVEYKKVSMAVGKDGREYDISTLDTKLIPFVDVRNERTEDYIVIDWS